MEPLPQQLRPHLRGRLRRRLLQLQVGGGARGGCFCRLRGARGVRPADRAAISRCDLEPRRQPRRARGVHRVSRPTPGRDGAAPATRHTRPGRDPRVRRSLAALAAALLLLCALAPQRSRAEELYVIEQLVVSLNNAPDATGERIGSLKSGDKVEVIERSGDQAHVRTASGREGWVRASYLTAEEPLQARLAERTAEVARLKEDLGRLAAQPEAARTGAVAAEPPEEAVRAPRGGLFGKGPDERGRRVWPWAPVLVLVALIVGFALGSLVLDRHIRRKYGGLRIY